MPSKQFNKNNLIVRFLEGKSYIYHVLGWLIFLFLPIIASPINYFKNDPVYTSFLIAHFTKNLFLIVLFYLNLYYFIPALLHKKKKILFITHIIVGLLLNIGLNILLGKLLFSDSNSHQISGKNISDEGLFFFKIMVPIFSYFFMIMISSMIGLVKDRTLNNEIQQKTILEKTKAELAVLKFQISPHFLFNTLNNIRWLARTNSSKTDDSIVKLSELLRYMIYNVANNKVPLKQEMEHLKNYIELQKLRLTSSGNIHYDFDPNLNEVLIEPLLFIPFIENAFKYGIDTKQEPEINISIKRQDQTLIFECKNKIFTNNYSTDSGIGIANVKQRLEILYKKNHIINIENDSGYFYVKIEINHLI